MVLFSERFGFSKPRSIFQKDSIDEALRVKLWNVVFEAFITPSYSDYYGQYKPFGKTAWHFFFKKGLDGFNFNDFANAVKVCILTDEWWSVYNLIEFFARRHPMSATQNFEETCNATLEQEMSGWRLINNSIAPIIDDVEIASITAGLSVDLPTVRTHLAKAFEAFSKRPNPDFENAIKESISSVESLCCLITGDAKATLGKALDRLENAGLPIHGALRVGFDKIYGWTSDDKGIRHGSIDGNTATFAEAKFMIVACSAFVNYLIEECREHKIKIPKALK